MEEDTADTDLWNELNTVSTSEQEYDRLSDVNTKVQLFSPQSLLIESLIDQLCRMVEKDPVNQSALYFKICEKLFQMDLIDKSYRMEEFNFMRTHYQKALYQLFSVAKSEYVENTQFISKPTNVITKQRVLFDWSRYKNEYQELEYIARGGFGHVYKVRNRLDGGIYAIKKICLRFCNGEGFLRSLHEVQMLARLDDAHIVSYKAAWLEPLLLVSGTNASPIHDNQPVSQVTNNGDRLPSAINYNNSDSSQVVFQNSGGQEENDDGHLQNAITEPDAVVTSIDPIGEIRNNMEQQSQDMVVLFIQMKMCNETLRQWLDRRNKTIDEVQTWDRDSDLCIKQSLDVFKQIIQGLCYIHLKGIVHHDIKPSNIFISDEGKLVQVGDFGLACSLLPLADHPDSKVPLNTSFKNDRKHHTVLGTKLYAAPEQLRGFCDAKSDIYSAGVILVELIVPFHTEMERVRTINSLKEGLESSDIISSIPSHLLELIRKLLSKDTSWRPTADQLLNILDTFNNDLHVLIRKQTSQINELMQQLTIKDDIITKLQHQISQLDKCNN